MYIMNMEVFVILSDEELISVVAVLRKESLPLSTDSCGAISPGENCNEFLTEQGTVVKVTQSISEAIIASIGTSSDITALPNYISVSEVCLGEGAHSWIVEMEALDAQHELALIAGTIVELADSLEQIENFDLLNVEAKGNRWAFESGYPKDTICRVMNDLQSALFSHEMSGFINTNVNAQHIAVKDVDGEATVVITEPTNKKIEEALLRTKASITHLNPNCQSVFKVTLNECLDAFAQIKSAERNQAYQIENSLDERLTPSLPVVLNR